MIGDSPLDVDGNADIHIKDIRYKGTPFMNTPRNLVHENPYRRVRQLRRNAVQEDIASDQREQNTLFT